MFYFFLDGNEKGIFWICEKMGKIYLDRLVVLVVGMIFILIVKVMDGDFCLLVVLKILIILSC